MSSAEGHTELSELLCFDLYAASRAITAVYRALLAELGLTYPQYLVLTVLWSEHTHTVKQLSEALRLDYGTLTPLLRRMEAHGLVTRERGSDDERTVRVGLSPAGLALSANAQEIKNAISDAFGLNPDQADDLQSILRSVTAAATGYVARQEGA